MSLKKNDKEIYELIQKERRRQAETLDLIASETYSSKEVVEALGSILTNKYAENYPGKRYYGGCSVFDEIGEFAKTEVWDSFDLSLGLHVNIPPYSGTSTY